MAATTIIVGPGSSKLGAAVCAELAGACWPVEVERFPDGEIAARLGLPVRGREVVVIQSTAPPVQERYFELFALADACRRDGAERVTAVVPYFGYARADTRHGRREPLMSRLAADLLERSGVNEVVTVDAHRPQLEGCFRAPLRNLSAVPLLCEALEERLEPDTVVVSPDLGGARIATAYGRRLGLDSVVLEKRRADGRQVEVRGTIGDVAGRSCLIGDDMVTTGGTVVEAIRALREAGARLPVTVSATHALLVDDAANRLAEAGVDRMVTTDSVEPQHPRPPWTETVTLAPLVADAVRSLVSTHDDPVEEEGP